MFDFQKLIVYQKSQELNRDVFAFLRRNKNIDRFLQDQLKRASTSISLNIAEGTGRLTRPDKARFFTISRGSVYEVVAIIETIANQYEVESIIIKNLDDKADEISRMLYSLIKNTTPTKI